MLQRDDFNGWLKVGPLGKCHLIAMKLHSTQLAFLWEQDLNVLLGSDNATRWNSW